jgi:ABC-type transport system substrate-binding protein
MYKDYNPNALVVFEAFEDYWNKENVGNIKTINAHIITNASTRTTALQTGELDFISVPGASWDQIQKSGKFETVLQEGNSTLCYIVAHHNADSPLADIRVRQALKYAVNQDAIIQVAAGGLGTKAEIMCNPTYIAGATVDDELKASFPYDVAKAKQLLADAGYPNGFTLTKPFLVPNSGDHEAVAQMLQAMWEEIGVKVTIEMNDSTTASSLAKPGDHQDLYMTTSAMTWDHSNQIRAIHSRNVKTTVAKYARANEAEAKELDTYLENGMHALTTKERDEWYLKADKFMDKMAVNVPLYHVSKAYAWDPALDCTIGTYYLYVQEWNWT